MPSYANQKSICIQRFMKFDFRSKDSAQKMKLKRIIAFNFIKEGFGLRKIKEGLLVQDMDQIKYFYLFTSICNWAMRDMQEILIQYKIIKNKLKPYQIKGSYRFFMNLHQNHPEYKDLFDILIKNRLKVLQAQRYVSISEVNALYNCVIQFLITKYYNFKDLSQNISSKTQIKLQNSMQSNDESKNEMKQHVEIEQQSEILDEGIQQTHQEVLQALQSQILQLYLHYQKIDTIKSALWIKYDREILSLLQIKQVIVRMYVRVIRYILQHYESQQTLKQMRWEHVEQIVNDSRYAALSDRIQLFYFKKTTSYDDAGHIISGIQDIVKHYHKS